MTPSRKILIAAQASLRAGLVEQLALYPEFALFEAETADIAVGLLTAKAPDLLLVDADLPRVIERARAIGFDGPILALANQAQDGPSDLSAGANERIARPFRFADLLARIRARLRRTDAAKEDVFAIGPYKFRPGSSELLCATGAKLRLTEKETAILIRLAQASGAAVSKDMLLRDVWGYNSAVTTRTLETHIYRLRRKLEPDSSKTGLLVSDRGGYRLLSR